MAFFTGRWGFILAALWLIATGATSLLGLTFNGIQVVMDVVAIVAGLLILFKR